MTRSETILSSARPVFFVTTAYGKAGKADMARKFGYELLDPRFMSIAEEAGRREDLFADHFGLRVVDHHYLTNNKIPNTVHVAANKAEGVDRSFESLYQTNRGQAIELTGREYEVMDNQMVIVDPQGSKVAFKKPRTDSAVHFQADINTLISTIRLGSLRGSHIEYLSAFVKGVFGHPTAKEYKTVRTIMGQLKGDINADDLEHFIVEGSYITGGVDVTHLINFIDHSEAQIRTRKYSEIGRHYITDEKRDEQIVLIDGLAQNDEQQVTLPSDYTSNPHILGAIARGFV